MTRLEPYLKEIPTWGAIPFEGCRPLLECRAAERLPAEAKAVIVCGFPYYTGEYPGRNLSRYAIVPDYHRVAGKLMEQACIRLREAFQREFQWFADNSPIREVDAACRAGLGVRGRNGLLIHPVYGSWLFLGAIVTDLDMETPGNGNHAPASAAGPAKGPAHPDASERAGPDPDRCLSAITQKKGELTPEEILLDPEGRPFVGLRPLPGGLPL